MMLQREHEVSRTQRKSEAWQATANNNFSVGRESRSKVAFVGSNAVSPVEIRWKRYAVVQSTMVGCACPNCLLGPDPTEGG
jgi:hypothetical protein